MKALHFGAGNIGKGFIGSLLNETGYEVCFVDVDQKMIDRFNKNNKYFVEILAEDQPLVEISPVTALNSLTQGEEVIDAIVEADLITTSVGVNNFSNIAPIIARGLLKRASLIPDLASAPGLDVIANENAINATSILKVEIAKQVSENEMEVINSFVGFPNAAVDRVALSKESEKYEIASVEPTYEWVINKSEMVNLDLPPIQGALYVEDLKPFIERKLYIVNLGHATVAYIGFLFGESTIQHALKNDKIEHYLRGTLAETSQYFIGKLNVDAQDMQDYIEKTISRFKNEHIHDDIFRVGREPIRKLGYNERLLKPLKELSHMDLPIEYLTLVIAAAFLFNQPDDEEAIELQEYIEIHGITQAISHFTALDDNNIKKKIELHYEQLKAANHKELEQILENHMEGESLC